MTLAEWLTAERKGLGWSQRDLAKESGVPKSTVNLLESGRSVQDAVLVLRLRQVVDALGISAIEAYHRAGLLTFTDPDDAECADIALRARRLSPGQRDELLRALRELEERG